ncbi:MAG: hypothetical protein GXC73_13005 [Chitinophagaceae bacterium]|nr:hypothetical protein [Chitinophagaceae bacterium]
MKYLIPLFLFVASFESTAQKVSVKVVNTNDVTNHTVKWTLQEKTDFKIGDNIIQVENTGSRMQLGYTAKLSREKHALTLHKINMDGKEIATGKLENGERVFGPSATVPLLFNNKLLLVYFRYEADTMKLYLSEVDDESLTIKSTQLLYKFAQRNVGLFGMNSLSYEIMTSISPDQKKLLIAYRNSNGQMFSSVFSSDLSALRTKISNPLFPEKAEISDVFLENSGNCVFGLSSTLGSEFEHLLAKGFLVQRIDNSERVIPFNIIGANFTPEHLRIQPSADFSKLYACGDYSGDRNMEGVFVVELNTQQFRLSKPFVFAYPEEFKERMYKTGFGTRKKDNYTVMPVDYQLIEVANGEFALGGYAKTKYEGSSTSGRARITFLAGPVVTIFFDKEFKQANFAMIPRNHTMRSGSAGIFLPYQGKLVVLYNDYAKNFDEDLSDASVDRIRINMVKEVALGYAVINKNGKIEQRKLLTEGISRMNYFNTMNFKKLSETHIVIPSAADDKKTDMNKVASITISD